MSIRFEFATAGRILFGTGLIAQAGHEAAGLGRKALVVTGRHPDRAAPLFAALNAGGVDHHVFPTDGEPDLGVVEAGAHFSRERGCDCVIGFGGGSTIDAAKAIAAMSTNRGDIHEHLEVIGTGKPLTAQPLPVMAIPTTAGAGAEVTRNAVLRSREFKVKVSLRSPWLLPQIALVDPQLTHSLPPEVTAATGIDALTQLIEPFLSIRANALVDGFCTEGLACAARSLRRVVMDPENPAARQDMALASLLGGMALANAGLGAVHGLAAPLGGMFDAPHGAVCAALLPHVMDANLLALMARHPGHPAIGRFQRAAAILTGDPSVGLEDGVVWLRETCRLLGIPGLAQWGVSAEPFPAVAEKAVASSSMKSNPVILTQEELLMVLHRALR